MTNNNLTVITLNVNGLGNKTKRCTIFKFLNTLQADIILLQETHSDKGKENLWKTEWNNKQLFFNHGETNSKGVLTAISKDDNIEIMNIRSDSKGRVLTLDIKLNNSIYKIINTYMSVQSKENQQIDTLIYIQEEIEKTEHDFLIIGGDINIHMDPILDAGNLMEKKN